MPQSPKKGMIILKKVLAFSLVLALILSVSIPVFATEISGNEDTVYYGESEISTLNQVPYNRVEIPDESIAITAEEDVVYYGINELNPEEFIRVTPNTVDVARASYLSYDFAGAVSNSVYSDFIEHTVAEGSSVTLTVDICVWEPISNDLEIGIYNWTTGENWRVIRSGGQVVDYAKTFTGLSAGKYSAYVRNLGSTTLTTGYILYDLS